MNTEALARQHGKPVQEQNAEVEYLFTLDGIEALLAAEREACAQILDRNVAVCGNNTPMRDVLAGNAMAIRARSNP
jgi:hypothetical protein